jgi:hypothetical protein
MPVSAAAEAVDTPVMHPGIEAWFGRQAGLITRDQLLDLGITPNRITHALEVGELKVVRRGVYADPRVWQAADEYRGRPRLRGRAAVMSRRRGWVLSHDSAAHELGMEILAPVEPMVHLTRPGLTNAWTKAGVKHHLARFREDQVVVANGLRSLDLARTAVDIARERGVRHGLPACDSALRMGVPRERLWDAVAPMHHWRGAPAARTSIELADGGAQTVIESLGRELVHELGIGLPETQFPVQTVRGVAWCDIRVGNHIFECDGRMKYLTPERGGIAVRDLEDIMWEEKQRQTLVCAEGLGMSRITWPDFWGDRRAEAISRLRAEYAVSVRTFGAELAPHLAHNAEMIRRGESA